MDFVSGKEAGTTFEKLFERQCQLSGLWAYEHGIKAKRAWRGKLIEQKSDLDFKVMGRGGKIAFVDCKTYENPYFTFSDVPAHQLELAARYNDFGFPAGFVVWFRPINRVVFFPGWLVRGRGPGTRFLPQDGRPLGSWERFEPSSVFDSPSGSTSGILG